MPIPVHQSSSNRSPFVSVAIFGATGGIGRALVRHYAAPGVRLSLAGRSESALDAARREALALQADAVVLSSFDIRNRSAAESWARKQAELGIDLLIIASGVSSSAEVVSFSEDQSEALILPEHAEDLQREMDVNATGAILIANVFVRRILERRREKDGGMRSGPRVQIGLIASLAAMTGLVGSPGYSASKAALRIYGQALRRLCAPEGIGVTVLLPGYVESSMSRRYIGAKPWLMSADRAADIMARALEANRGECAFPSILAWGIRALSLLPECLQKFFLKGFFFTVAPDEETVALRGQGARSGGNDRSINR